MSERKFGVVLEQDEASFYIWPLFNGIDAKVCAVKTDGWKGRFRIGDIIQEVDTGFVRARPFDDSLWRERGRVVVRCVVGVSQEITLDRGPWTDDAGSPFVILFSRDLGLVVAPYQWYDREFVEADACYLLVHTEFHPLTLHSSRGERVDCYWTVITSRLSLTAVPSRVQEEGKFLKCGLRNVPVLTIFRKAELMVVWSYALGHQTAVMVGGDLRIGQWFLASVALSPESNVRDHGCMYTVMRCRSMNPNSQLEVKVDRGRISMVQTLHVERNVDNPNVPFKLIHDIWGLPVSYDDRDAEWIREESDVFRAIVKIVVDDHDGCRATLKATGPQPVERPISVPSGPHQFEDVEELKAALPYSSDGLAFPRRGHSDGEEAKEAKSNDNSNNNCDDWYKYPGRTMQTTSYERNYGEKKSEDEMTKQETGGFNPSEKVSWSNIPRLTGGRYGALVNTGAANNDGVSGAKSADQGSCTSYTSSAKAHAKKLADQIPIRAHDDKRMERQWKREMKEKGWEMPPEKEELVIPDGEDGWDHAVGKDFGKLPTKEKPAMPVENLRRRYFTRDVVRLKTKRCLITKVGFADDWKTPDRIRLFVLESPPFYVTYRIPLERESNIRNMPDFTTVGNIVDLNLCRNQEGFYVYDELWHFISKVKLPCREVILDGPKVKSLELIVIAKCLSPEEQSKWRGNHENDENTFTILEEEMLQKIVYYGQEIDPQEHWDYTFQMVVQPEGSLDGNVLWRATEVLWRIQNEPLGFGPRETAEKKEVPSRPPCTSGRPVEIELHASAPRAEYTVPSLLAMNVSREVRLGKVIELLQKIVECDSLLAALRGRIGLDYRTKIITAIEAGVTSIPHQKSMKKELSMNADFLQSLIDNTYAEEIFRAQGKKKLWMTLTKVAQEIKAYRTAVYG